MLLKVWGVTLSLFPISTAQTKAPREIDLLGTEQVCQSTKRAQMRTEVQREGSWTGEFATWDLQLLESKSKSLEEFSSWKTCSIPSSIALLGGGGGGGISMAEPTALARYQSCYTSSSPKRYSCRFPPENSFEASAIQNVKMHSSMDHSVCVWERERERGREREGMYLLSWCIVECVCVCPGWCTVQCPILCCL